MNLENFRKKWNERFEKRINVVAEYTVLLVIWLAIVAAFCGAWWQLLWVAMLPLWVFLRVENTCKQPRRVIDWVFEFLLIMRCVDYRRYPRLWNPLTWILLIFFALIVGLFSFMQEFWQMVKDTVKSSLKEQKKLKTSRK